MNDGACSGGPAAVRRKEHAVAVVVVVPRECISWETSTGCVLWSATPMRQLSDGLITRSNVVRVRNVDVEKTPASQDSSTTRSQGQTTNLYLKRPVRVEKEEATSQPSNHSPVAFMCRKGTADDPLVTRYKPPDLDWCPLCFARPPP